MMQRDLRRAVEARRHDADTSACRGVANHVVMLEAALPHGARQDAVERDGSAAGQAHLATMSVACQEDVEIGMRRLPIDFGRMRQENREGVVRDALRRLLDIIHAVEMRVVDASKMNGRASALDPQATLAPAAAAYFEADA